jgi:hypothetical protein
MGDSALGYADNWQARDVIDVLEAAGAKRIQPAGEQTWLRRMRCPSCGAPKLTLSPTAYGYCDYCASYIDYDYSRPGSG